MGCHCVFVESVACPVQCAIAPILAGEPSAPKLEGHVGEDGNSIKVNLIKQDDGGSPIRHYLIKYRVVSLADKTRLASEAGF